MNNRYLLNKKNIISYATIRYFYDSFRGMKCFQPLNKNDVVESAKKVMNIQTG